MGQAGKRAQRLRDIVDRLPEAQAQALLDYAEFLLQRYGIAAPPGDPIDIPRVPNESVVGAIKRLRASYPMLDAAQLLNETSALMSEHALKGRAADDVINELERLFRQHYQRSLTERNG